MAGEVKSFVYTWAAKQKYPQPQFSLLPDGPSRFNYQLVIEGLDHVGSGGGGNKKEAEATCARNMLQYLIDNSLVAESSVPPNILVRYLLCVFEICYSI